MNGTRFTFDQETKQADLRTSPEAIRRTLAEIKDYAMSSPAIQEDINRRKETLKKKMAMADEADLRKAQRRYGYDKTVARGFDPVMNGSGNPDIVNAEHTVSSTIGDDIPEARVVEDFLEKLSKVDASQATSDKEI